MRKMDHTCNKVEPFAALFWAFGIVLGNIWPCPPPARHHSTAVHKACSFMVRVGSILKEDALSFPPFLYLGMLLFYGLFQAPRFAVKTPAPVRFLNLKGQSHEIEDMYRWYEWRGQWFFVLPRNINNYVRQHFPI